MACGCSKNKSANASKAIKAPTKLSRPLGNGGRIRRIEKRIIR